MSADTMAYAYAFVGGAIGFRVACRHYDTRDPHWNAREADAFLALVLGLLASVLWPLTVACWLIGGACYAFADYRDRRKP